MISQLCNLLILTLLVKKFLFKPVQKILAERQAAADAVMAEARSAREQAQAMQAEYEQSMAGARGEAARIVEDATRAAGQRSEELLAEAAASARRIKERVKDEIGGMAMEIASKVVEREIDEKDHQALIDEFIKNVGDAS